MEQRVVIDKLRQIQDLYKTAFKADAVILEAQRTRSSAYEQIRSLELEAANMSDLDLRGRVIIRLEEGFAIIRKVSEERAIVEFVGASWEIASEAIES